MVDVALASNLACLTGNRTWCSWEGHDDASWERLGAVTQEYNVQAAEADRAKLLAEKRAEFRRKFRMGPFAMVELWVAQAKFYARRLRWAKSLLEGDRL